MTYTIQTGGAPQGAWAGHLKGLTLALAARRARRRVFRQTVAEMNMLTDRDLTDLGLARRDIRRVAWQAAQDI